MTVDQRELAAFVGWQARLWDYTPTHDRLVIRLVAPDQTQAFLVFSLCESLNVPTLWHLVNPTVVRAEVPFVEFVDDGVRILCEEVLLQPTYTRSP
jgi:hypothetical protein